ncbi:hypothetical protein TNCV_2575851 [Trichonephila clavipes]|uniref:Uncharacterized protein n=1 Tax=Trichonephila clavipes TaxID=2585209 RepID=A0A8X6UZ35_TRICX|nr:hypothetical protein TNCV_2575851 [Trichonephila clavipes]
MEENKHLNVEMGPEASNVRGVSQEACLQNQNMGSYDSEAQNGSLVEVDMQDKYSCLMRCVLLMCLEDSHVFSQFPFIRELEENVEFYAIYEVIHLLAMGTFRKKFNEILERRTEINANIDMDHAQFLLSRCVLLCREPTYPTFVLVVAFLTNVLILDVDDLECFKVAYITEFCLSVLYRRIFWKIFRSREDYRRLHFFCKQFNKKFGQCSAMIKLPKTSVNVNWQKLIQGCIEDPNIEFPLEESEIEMFNKARRVMDNMESTRGLLETDHVILNNGQVTGATLELAPPSPNYHTNLAGIFYQYLALIFFEIHSSKIYGSTDSMMSILAEKTVCQNLSVLCFCMLMKNLENDLTTYFK